VAIGEASHALNEEGDNAHEQKRNEQKEDELGEVPFYEGESIVVPAPEDICKVQIILRAEERKGHY
jgi:hypothetical protein